jgi:hypothetical protein
MACDRCGKKGCVTNTLRNVYQADGIKDVCSECQSEIDAELERVRSIAMRWWSMRVRAFVAGRPLAKRWFWRGPKMRPHQVFGWGG